MLNEGKAVKICAKGDETSDEYYREDPSVFAFHGTPGQAGQAPKTRRTPSNAKI